MFSPGTSVEGASCERGRASLALDVGEPASYGKISPARRGTARFARLNSGGRPLLYAPIPRDSVVARLPIALRVLLENLTRQSFLGFDVSGELEALVGRLTGARVGICPARVVLDEATGVPLLIDVVSLRDAVAAAGGNSGTIQPRLPVDLLLDSASSCAGGDDAGRERNELLSWCRTNFPNLRIVSSGTRGAPCHFGCPAEGVRTEVLAGMLLVYPDLLVGAHEYTSALNGCGVVGWGVGGLEATAMLLGKPLSLALPEVVGVELLGRPPSHLEPDEVALRLSEELRGHALEGKLVEFFGRGVETLPVSIRAMVSSMAPEIGATSLYFPTDGRTLDHLRSAGHPQETIRLLEQYAKRQSLWLDVVASPPEYDTVVTLDLRRTGRSALRPGYRLVARSLFDRAALATTRRHPGRVARADLGAGETHGNRFPWPRPGGWVSRAPFFDGLPLSTSPLGDLVGGRPLVVLGDSVRVEDISPSGAIAAGCAAESYLRAAGVTAAGAPDTYEMRRGNYEIAVRATFAGPRLRNRLAGGARGGVTMLMPERVLMGVFDAASEYQRRDTPLIVIAGLRYGCGRAHDWAAKGVASLGVRAVMAESFEPMHRASLIAAGVLPLVFIGSYKATIAALDGSETFDLPGLDWSVGVRTQVRCIVRRDLLPSVYLTLLTAVETADELYYLRSGGVLPALWREQLRGPHYFRFGA